ncbi:MAG TPA: ABC transporter permease [Candidatus Bathyarchaeia archaeon]|nr:ABC transporter permease [Candidatus Bathyarchaeia archaeon]
MFIPVKYNYRYLITRWKGTAMTALTFAMVVATFVIVMSLAQGIERALTTTGEPLNVIVLRPGVQSEGQSQISIARYQVIRTCPGIAKDDRGEPLVSPEVLTLVNKPRTGSGKPSNLQIRGVHPQGIRIRPAFRIIEGRMFKPGLREIVVSRSVSNRFINFHLGDKVRLGRGTWTVVGIFDAAGTAYDSEVWADYQEVMQEFDRDAYSVAILRAVDPAAVDAIRARLEDDPRIKLTALTEEQYYKEQTSTAAPLKAFAGFLAVIMSIGACFAGMNTMYANVANRTREIGTLRILGFTPFAVLVSFLLESVFLALAGGILGCLMAFPMNGWATGTTNFESFSEIVFYFTITPELVMKGLVFAAIMGLLGGFLPAWSASRKPVLAALRQL